VAEVVPLSAGEEGRVLIEIEPNLVALEGPLGDGEIAGAAEKVVGHLRDIGRSAADVCNEVYGNALDALKVAKPSELALEFGLTLGGEAGIPFVSKGTAEATFKITATWSP
jgi:hypothetical protein